MTRISSPVFVGRRTEIADLTEAWVAAASGHGRLRLVYGEAGIGKTRLLGALAERILAGGGAVARGRCLDIGEGTLPFGPIVEAVRHLGVDPDPLARVDPAGDGGGGPPVESPPEAGLRRYFEALAAGVAAAARSRPVAFLVEDAQWLDPASRDLLRYLVHALQDEPVLVVVTIRDDAPSGRTGVLRSLLDLEREPHAGRLDLERFSVGEVEAQLAGILGRPPGAGLAASVHGRSDGNPFFTEEIVALDIAESSHVPPSLRDLVLSRVSSLDEPARRLLHAAAVGGRWVPDEQLGRVVRMADRRLDAALRSAFRGHLLEAEPREGTAGIAFRHALVRDAVYGDILAAERRQLHAAWATELETMAPASAAVAEHWALAGRPDRAAPGFVRAAERAVGAYAHADAARLYGRALEALGAGPAPSVDGLDRIDLLERAAEAHEFASERDEAIECLVQATADPAFRDRPDRALRLLRLLAEVAVNRARNPLAKWAIDEALSLVPDEPTAEGASALATWAMQLSLAGELDAARLAATRAAEVARRIGAPAAEARALRALAELRAMVDVDAGVAALEDAARVAEAAGDVGYQFETLSDVPWALANAGRYEDALRATDEVHAGAVAAGIGGKLLRTHLARRIEYLTALGRFSDAEPDIEAAAAARGWMARLRAAILRARQGRADDAATLIREAFELAPVVSPTVPDRGAVALAKVNVAIASGDPADAVDLVDEAGALPGEADSESELRLLALRACCTMADRARRADARAAWTERAHAQVRRLLELDDGAGRPMASATRARALDGRAELGRLEGRRDPAAWAAVAAAWSSLSVPERVAYARYREAEAGLVGGLDRRAAEAALRDALQQAVNVGTLPLVTEIEALARRGRVSLGEQPDATGPGQHGGAASPTPADPHGLTERERDVLALLVDGRTNRQIGEALFISPKTAGVHVSNILGKLGATNRVEAASIAHRLGLPASRGG